MWQGWCLCSSSAPSPPLPSNRPRPTRRTSRSTCPATKRPPAPRVPASSRCSTRPAPQPGPRRRRRFDRCLQRDQRMGRAQRATARSGGPRTRQDNAGKRTPATVRSAAKADFFVTVDSDKLSLTRRDRRGAQALATAASCRVGRRGHVATLGTNPALTRAQRAVVRGGPDDRPLGHVGGHRAACSSTPGPGVLPGAPPRHLDGYLNESFFGRPGSSAATTRRRPSMLFCTGRSVQQPDRLRLHADAGALQPPPASKRGAGCEEPSSGRGGGSATSRSVATAYWNHLLGLVGARCVAATFGIFFVLLTCC